MLPYNKREVSVKYKSQISYGSRFITSLTFKKYKTNVIFKVKRTLTFVSSENVLVRHIPNIYEVSIPYCATFLTKVKYFLYRQADGKASYKHTYGQAKVTCPTFHSRIKIETCCILLDQSLLCPNSDQ